MSDNTKESKGYLKSAGVGALVGGAIFAFLVQRGGMKAMKQGFVLGATLGGVAGLFTNAASRFNQRKKEEYERKQENK